MKREIMNSKGILNFVLIGAKSSGKTIYLSTLWGKGLLRNTHKEDKKYLQETWNYIQKHGKAEASSGMFKILHFAYPHHKYGRLDFSIDDYDGSFTETISVENNNTEEERRKLMNSVKQSEGIFFFFPYESAPDRLKDFAQEIDTFIQLAQFSSHNKSPIPASIVVTKWDESEHFSDSEEVFHALEYIKNNEYLKRTLKLIEQSFKNTTIIPISSFKEHNLLKPIDYSLDKTFEQWHSAAKLFKIEKKYEELLKYLSKRHNDTKFNEVFDFNKLYAEAQELFLPEVKIAISKKSGYEEKEIYFDEIYKFYQTKPELLKPIKEEVNKEKRQTKFKKKRNKVLSIAILSILIIGLFGYINKMNVEEEYKAIIDKYSKGVEYKSVRTDIKSFLDSYNNVSFFYAFADVPTKRAEIIRIQNKLKQEDVIKIEEDAADIITNDNMTAGEKKDALVDLKDDASDDQKKDLENKARRQKYKDNTIKWMANAEGCLKTCEGRSGLKAIENLLQRANNTDGIIRNDDLKKKVIELQGKKESLLYASKIVDILEKLDSADTYNDFISLIADIPENVQTNRSIKEKIVSLYLLFISNTNSLDELSDIISRMSDDTFSTKNIRDKCISIVRLLNKNEYQTVRGKQLLNDLKVKHSRENFNRHIKDDIKKFIEAKAGYDRLMKEITNKPGYKDLTGVDYSQYNSFDKFEKNNIVSTLNEKMTQSLKSIMDGVNLNKLGSDYLIDTEQNLKKIKEIASFKINNGGLQYTYTIRKDQEAKISIIREDYNLMKKLVQNGIKNIEVTIVGHENNSIEFRCSQRAYYMGKRDDIDITGFSQDLNSKDAGKCEGEDTAHMTYNKKISIKAKKAYSIKVTDPSILAKLDDSVSGNIQFELRDLYNLSEGLTITKSLDKERIVLKFRKAN